MGKASNRKKARRRALRGFKPWDPEEYVYGSGWGSSSGDLQRGTVVIRAGQSVGKSTAMLSEPWARTLMARLRQSGKTEITRQLVMAAQARLRQSAAENVRRDREAQQIFNETVKHLHQ